MAQQFLGHRDATSMSMLKLNVIMATFGPGHYAENSMIFQDAYVFTGDKLKQE